MSEQNSSQSEQTPNSANPPSPSSWFAGWAEFSTEPPAEATPTPAPLETDAPNQAAADHDYHEANLRDMDLSHDMDLSMDLRIDPVSSPSASWEEWQPVNFPNAISADAIERQSIYGHGEVVEPQLGRPQSGQSQSGQPPLGSAQFIQPKRQAESFQPMSPTTRRISPDRPSWEVATPAASEPEAAAPNVADLISLIQELNQCNNALLDRVSMLEDALEQQQARAATAIAADQLQATIQPLEQQIVQLTEQLEATQQLSHRQQVLAETVTQELALSQERIKQLEQENQLAQQRYEEQAQRLARSEALVRDLQARLQRQQRYTLQFKAALERCLEVPTALLDTPAEAIARPTDQPWQAPATERLSAPALLPKVATIRPWSAEATEATVPPKLVHVLASQPTSEEETVAWLGDVVSADSRLIPETERNSATLPDSIPAESEAEPSLSRAEGSEPAASPGEDAATATVATNVIALQFGQVGQAVSPPAPAVASASPEIDSANTLTNPLTNTLIPESAATPQSTAELRAADLSAADNVRSLFREFTELVNEVGSAPSTDPNAETTLWQDLAKLVEISAEDLVQAGLIDQLAALSTEAIAPDGEIHPTSSAGDPSPETSSLAQPSADDPQQTSGNAGNAAAQSAAFAPAASAPIPPMPPRPVSVQPKLLTMPFETHRWAAATPEPVSPARPDSHSREAANPEAAANLAPVVYPARSAKKLSSLAAIDLPNFPK